jgi:hypothetical protein
VEVVDWTMMKLSTARETEIPSARQAKAVRTNLRTSRLPNVPAMNVLPMVKVPSRRP